MKINDARSMKAAVADFTELFLMQESLARQFDLGVEDLCGARALDFEDLECIGLEPVYQRALPNIGKKYSCGFGGTVDVALEDGQMTPPMGYGDTYMEARQSLIEEISGQTIVLNYFGDGTRREYKLPRIYPD